MSKGTKEEDQCYIRSSAAGRMLAIRAMVILGLLLMVGASVSYLLQRFMMKSNPRLTQVAAGLAISGGILMLMGPIIYATASDIKALLELEGVSLHAGFALCIVAAVAGMAAGISMNLTKPE
ncbi:uncharacterized protein LOC128215499 [Mya arenaria]|uniref:uncharacterized protein LOC128215499 n=1 Tax=Mya arenaria TaxID=6604 RepID=UPI0022E7D50D|nr:uncharacterized protein LOC128215499 [Mya arenaria]